jgi:hypothetical protein
MVLKRLWACGESCWKKSLDPRGQPSIRHFCDAHITSKKDGQDNVDPIGAPIRRPASRIQPAKYRQFAREKFRERFTQSSGTIGSSCALLALCS